jgi:hypothetical protein
MSEARRTCTLNQTAFDVVSEESAYWIGFLMADGCVHHPKNGSPQIILRLNNSDREHLQSFKNFLGSSSKIIPAKDHTVSLTVTSRRIADTLSRYGIIQRKSLNAKVSGLEHDRHFWRGVIDGDGWIHSNPLNKKSGLINLCGSQNLTSQFASYALEIAGGKLPAFERRENLFIVRLYSDRAMRVIKCLYSDCSISLPRKQERADRVIESLATSQAQ